MTYHISEIPPYLPEVYLTDVFAQGQDLIFVYLYPQFWQDKNRLFGDYADKRGKNVGAAPPRRFLQSLYKPEPIAPHMAQAKLSSNSWRSRPTSRPRLILSISPPGRGAYRL